MRVRSLGRPLPSGSVFDNAPLTILRMDPEQEAVAGAIARKCAQLPG